MHTILIVVIMFGLPVVSILVEAVSHGGLGMALIGKWFVFWSVGVRLLTAGLRQIIQPRYTAAMILGINDAQSLVLVRELGFANTAIGAVGVSSVFMPAWVLPGAVTGFVFFGLAGLNHSIHKARTRLQNVAMVSDLVMAAVLLMVTLAAI
jgi:hypothetical protein